MDWEQFVSRVVTVLVILGILALIVLTLPHD
jgi:hypothetical protein